MRNYEVATYKRDYNRQPICIWEKLDRVLGWNKQCPNSSSGTIPMRHAQGKNFYFPDDPHWHIEQGSVLDDQYISGLGQFEVAKPEVVFRFFRDAGFMLE